MKKIARPSVFTAEAYLSDRRKDSGARSRSSMGWVWAYLHPPLPTSAHSKAAIDKQWSESRRFICDLEGDVDCMCMSAVACT